MLSPSFFWTSFVKFDTATLLILAFFNLMLAIVPFAAAVSLAALMVLHALALAPHSLLCYGFLATFLFLICDGAPSTYGRLMPQDGKIWQSPDMFAHRRA